MNIDPVSTMAAVERLIEGTDHRPRGVIATLKLPDWSRADELSGWLERFRSWGYEPRARQLSTGGRELCVVALRPDSEAAAATRTRRATRFRGPRGSRNG
jgi:hypothetical protein